MSPKHMPSFSKAAQRRKNLLPFRIRRALLDRLAEDAKRTSAELANVRCYWSRMSKKLTTGLAATNVICSLRFLDFLKAAQIYP